MTRKRQPPQTQNPRIWKHYDWEPYLQRAKDKPGYRIKAAEDIPRSGIVSLRGVIKHRNANDADGGFFLRQQGSYEDPVRGLCADVYLTYEKED